ncbi:hypothetical protein DN824_10405 [Stutzerimonas nosocomialis]|uniref:hypothetical protein n=1 Tax=Stutzerimonas nosocomialis TaxID=1056496 RepID=UPI0011080B1E|nr:hypothetical protein [Stutzerimonas nosocomialis]TLX58050.1 hypothetical protein DN824_10405 [Stutzerimonas nosocomialis]
MHLRKLTALCRSDRVAVMMLITLMLLLLLVFSLGKSLFFNSIPIDGAFQHLNPMRRIAAGELPGQDFHVFHGLAISYLHYPLYLLFGETLFASEMSRYFLNGLAGYAAVLALFAGSERWRTALVLAVAYVVLTRLLGLFWLTDPFGNAYSSLAVRTLVPALAFGYLLYANRRGMLESHSVTRIVMPLALASAAAMVAATEQGAALFLASAGGLLILRIGHSSLLVCLRDVLVLVVASVLLYLLLVFVASGGTPLAALRFTWRDLPSDQFWYFGAYPNIFAQRFSDLFLVPGTSRPLTVFFVAGLATLWALARLPLLGVPVERRANKIWLMALAYGYVTLISNLGMVSSHYSEALLRISSAFLFLSVFAVVRQHIGVDRWQAWRAPFAWVLVLVVMLFPGRFQGLAWAGVDLYRNYRETVLLPRHSGVLPVGREYQGLFDVAARIIPPAPLMGGRLDAGPQPIASTGYLLIRAPESVLASSLQQGDSITVNGVSETLAQVAPSHVLMTSKNAAERYEFRYVGRGGREIRLAPTPYYSAISGLWRNGVALPDDRGGCLMVEHSRKLRGVTRHRVVRFDGEAEERQVTSIHGNILCVSGERLEPYTHGFPVRFTVAAEMAFSLPSFELADYQGTARALYEIEQKSNSAVRTHDYYESYLWDRTYSQYSHSPLAAYKRQVARWEGDPCAPGEQPTLWSTYTGFLALQAEVVNPAQTDYIIHALGSDARKRYVERFAQVRPTYVHTLRSSYTAYERWLQTTTWEFYQLLLANYEVVGRTAYSLIWQRKPVNGSIAWFERPGAICKASHAAWHDADYVWEGEIEVPPGAQEIDLSSLVEPFGTAHQVVLLEVTYAQHDRYEAIPLLGKAVRYALKPIDTETPLPVGLAPYHNRVVFPLVVRPGGRPRLSPEAYALLGGASLEVLQIRYARVNQDVKSHLTLLLDH